MTDADLERYLGIRVERPAVVEKRARHDAEGDEAYTAAPLPLGVRPVARAPAPDMEALLKDYKGAPIMLSAERTALIPYDLWAAATTLLDGNRQGDCRLSRPFVAELQHLTADYKHEYQHVVDPLVLVTDSFSLPSGLVIYVEDAAPISLVLLALFLQCSLRLPNFAAAAAHSISDAVLRPYEGRLTQGCQRFGLPALVADEMERNGMDAKQAQRNMQLCMLRVGAMSSQEACDAIWIEDCLKEMLNIFKQ